MILTIYPTVGAPRDVGRSQPPVGSQLQLKLKEEVIGEQSSEAVSKARSWPYEVSPDGKRVAWLETRGLEWVAMVNGAPDGRAYDEVKWPVFSPDSRHLAYWARRGKTWMVVIDQKETGEYPDFGRIVRFSSDSAHHAYSVGSMAFRKDRKGEKSFMVSDSVKGLDFDDVEIPVFSPKGQRLAYGAKRGDSWIIVDGGKETTRGYRADAIQFTPVDERLIIVEDKGNNQLRYVIGGVEGPWFHALSYPAFGPTDDHFAYAGAKISSKRLFSSNDDQASSQIIVDGQAGRVYQSESFQLLSHDLFPALLDWGIQGGQRNFQSDRYGISTPVISPDGQHIAYAARLGRKHYVVMLDGQEVDSFESIPCDPAYSLEGGLYYAGFRQEQFIVTGNGKRLNELTLTNKNGYSQYLCAVTFDEGGHSTVELSWPQEHGSGWQGLLFVDGHPGREQVVGGHLKIQFVGDEFHTVYRVREPGKGKLPGRFHIVLDGVEGKSYDDILGKTPFYGGPPQWAHFSAEGEVRFVARSGRKFIHVTQSRSPMSP